MTTWTHHYKIWIYTIKYEYTITKMTLRSKHKQNKIIEHYTNKHNQNKSVLENALKNVLGVF